MREIVITGMGVVSPIGIGREAFAAALRAGCSGIDNLSRFDASAMPVRFGGQIDDFDPKQYVKPRKSLKVMSRDIQFAYTAADLACLDAKLDAQAIDSERLGVVFGSDMIYCDLAEIAGAYRGCMVGGSFDFSRWGEHALSEMQPLWLLKYLPNMLACHVGIARDARGPTNSITFGEASSLLSVAEGMRTIQRGRADAMIVGGAGSRLHPTALMFRGDGLLSHRNDQPRRACRPFDAMRDGLVNGEGAGAFVIEARDFAEGRGAKILARLLGYSSNFEPLANGNPPTGTAIRASIAGALQSAELEVGQVGHVNAHGLSTTVHDRAEAQAIRDCLGDVLVTAPKSFFGNLGAGTGAVEMAASLLAIEEGRVPVTLNYEQPDPECPVNVVHGEASPADTPTALMMNQTSMGQAVAVAIAAAE